VSCLVSILALIATPFAYIVNGWALSLLWDWFVVSTFDVPSLSIPIAIGLSIVVGYLTASAPDLDKASKPKSDWEQVASLFMGLLYSFFHPLFALGIGWIVLQFA
jgi:hypothetical protein